MPFTVAIDGPAASGKGTLARRLAKRYGFHHLDTGLTYRAVARALLESGVPLDDEEQAAEVPKAWPCGVCWSAGAITAGRAPPPCRR